MVVVSNLENGSSTNAVFSVGGMGRLIVWGRGLQGRGLYRDESGIIHGAFTG